MITLFEQVCYSPLLVMPFGCSFVFGNIQRSIFPFFLERGQTLFQFGDRFAGHTSMYGAEIHLFYYKLWLLALHGLVYCIDVSWLSFWVVGFA